MSTLAFIVLCASAAPAFAVSVPDKQETKAKKPLFTDVIVGSGLDDVSFKSCMESGYAMPFISQSMKEGRELGLLGTPYTVIDDSFSDQIFSLSGADEAGLRKMIQAIIDEKYDQLPPPLMGYAPPVFYTPMLGKYEAPITLNVYMDLECPFCRQFLPSLKKMVDEFPEFVRVVYRAYPMMQMHPNSLYYAHAVECAMDQGLSWQFIETLFDAMDTSGTDFDFTGAPKLPAPAPKYEVNFTNDGLNQQLVEVYPFTDEVNVIIPDMYKKFPELKKNGLMMLPFSKPENSDFVYFISITPDFFAAQPDMKLYKFNEKTKKMSRMNINSLFTPNIGDVKLSPDGTKALWIPVKKDGNARTLYMFDLEKDTRKTLMNLPAGETFDAGDGALFNFVNQVDWFSDDTIGYKVYSQTKKKKVGPVGEFDDEGREEVLTVRKGLIKLK